MEQEKSFLEVVNSEKHMLAVIHSKGITQIEVLELYRKIRTGYEKILINSNQMVECQEIEYHLWKLHYKLIDEFRKNHRQNMKNDSPPVLEGFRSFLTESTEFYKKLIVKLRKNCGLPEKIFFNHKDGSSFSIEPTKLHTCQYTCHRLLICLGDLARYTETVKKPDACDWSTAATYYLEATRIWPDSGNPHNQLALLATYVGDAFVALYHCVRSLAVKEPFPDAWKNVMLLFEENRSTKLESLSNEMKLDFLNPSTRISLQNTAHEENISPHKDKLDDLEKKSDLWPVLVRTISFFLIKSSLDDFPHTLASALNCLEALLSEDDTKLTTSLESYQQMDSLRKGPYRSIQLVSIFIFIVHSLTETPETEDSTKKDDSKTPFAFSAIFICMGRIIERCLRENRDAICPLVPAVLVFLEWLVEKIDTVEAHGDDERVVKALSYFFNALVDLLDRIDRNENIYDYTALWEDHELKGFYPLTRIHEKLDFATNLECMGDFSIRNECRLERIFRAATRLVNRSESSRERLFNSLKLTKFADRSPRNEEKHEEEEVILFKPITRRNSAPLYTSKATNDPVFPKMPPDEWLRRATSLSNGDHTNVNDSFSFSTTSNSGPTGPPSLSGWVLSRKNSNVERLSPIEEIPSTSFSDLSIDETKDSEVAVGHTSPCVITPTPSAPLLPDDAVWLKGNSLILPEYKKSGVGNEGDGILGAGPTVLPPVGYGPGLSGLVDGYPPFVGMMSSSEWLYHYRNSQNFPTNHVSPIHYNAPPFYQNEVSGFDMCDQWGNHLVSSPMRYPGIPGLYTDSFLGYQRPFGYGCGVGNMEMSSEQHQPTLLQYLKEKERQLQPGSQLRGPFM